MSTIIELEDNDAAMVIRSSGKMEISLPIVDEDGAIAADNTVLVALCGVLVSSEDPVFVEIKEQLLSLLYAQINHISGFSDGVVH